MPPHHANPLVAFSVRAGWISTSAALTLRGQFGSAPSDKKKRCTPALIFENFFPFLIALPESIG
jgi:hypothetical protein